MDRIIKTKTKKSNGFTLSYVLYERAATDAAGEEERRCFSVSVEKTDGKNAERAYADDIASSFSKAENIFDLLADNSVSPVLFTDVIEDMLY